MCGLFGLSLFPSFHLLLHVRSQSLEAMGRSVSSGGLRFIPLLLFFFSLLVNRFVLSTSPGGHHGAALPSPALSLSATIGGRQMSPSGSFLSLTPRPRSASLTFGSPGETGNPVPLRPAMRRRSLSLGRERRTASGVWSREGETANLLQPQQQEQQEQRQKDQQPQRRSGRLQRLRRAIGRMGVAAKEKLRRIWQHLRRGASRAKGAARRAAVAVFKRLPRLRRSRGPREAGEGAGVSGVAGAGLAAAAAGVRPEEETPEEAEPLKEEEILTPVSPAVSTTSTSAEESVQTEASAPVSEGLEQTEETEEWHEAPTPEQAEEASEEWYDAVTPEEMNAVLERARESEAVGKKEEAEKGKESKEAEGLALSPECLKYLPRMSTPIRQLCREWPGHCMFWTLFMKQGNLGYFIDGMQDLAKQTAASIQKAEKLKETENSIEAHLLRMHLTLALGEEAIAKAVDQTGELCWFLDPDNLYKKANFEEEKVLNSLNPVTFFANPLDFTQPLERLIRTAHTDAEKCATSFEVEIKAREDLQQILQSEKQKLEAAVKELGEELTEQQARSVQQAIDELEMLRRRESCSAEQAYLLAGQAKNIRGFITDYLANGRNWWRAQWPFKFQACRPLSKGSPVVPNDVAQSCRKYESSKPPKTSRNVSTVLLWMWEAGSCRKD